MNFYVFILGFFIVVGLATTLWGLSTLKKARKQSQWPAFDGQITSTKITSPDDDLLPEICFSYEVDQKQYSSRLAFPSGMTPMPEFAQNCVEKYPEGSKVTVYVDPAKPSNATLEPNQNGGHGLIIVMGLLMLVMGIGALFFS